MNEVRLLLKIYLSYLYHTFPPHMPIASSVLEISVVISIIPWTSHIHQLHQYDPKVVQLSVKSSPNDNLIISLKQSGLPGISYYLPPLQSRNLSVLPAFIHFPTHPEFFQLHHVLTALPMAERRHCSKSLYVSEFQFYSKMEKSPLLLRIGMD